MKNLVFDAGPIISLTMNNLLWILGDLKKQYRGKFLITEGVKQELIERPLKTKRFKFEAMQVNREINKGTLELFTDKHIKHDTEKLLNLANSIFQGRGKNLQIVHLGEMAALALVLHHKSDALVVDERTTRQLIENPARLLKLLGRKFHTHITLDKEKLKEFSEIVKDVKVIRSIELVTIAYEIGLLDSYKMAIPNAKDELLDALLWGLKIDGASISPKDIGKIEKLERY
tara:strand:+ start:4913 stop:5602 length:690 start_codon:yes stop_codon:yes gene_type:complete